MVHVKKAVILVAGEGTRLLPLTLRRPKGMLTVGGKPMIHYLIEELRDNGMGQIIVVTAPKQPQFAQYIKYLKSSPEWGIGNVRFDFTIQKKPNGSADAVLAAKKLLNSDPFFLFFCDYVYTSPEMVKNSIKAFAETQSPIQPLESVPTELASQYSTVHATRTEKNLYRINKIIEKPEPKAILSDLSAMPCPLLTKDFFRFVEPAKKLFKNKKELAVADVLAIYCQKGNPLYGWKFNGTVFDAGSLPGLLKANAYMVLQNQGISKKFKT